VAFFELRLQINDFINGDLNVDDFCSQIMGAFNVMPNDQHLKTAEGVRLDDNEATLADLEILPDTLILAKVSKMH
jgi:hypothetical protein